MLGDYTPQQRGRCRSPGRFSLTNSGPAAERLLEDTVGAIGCSGRPGGAPRGRSGASFSPESSDLANYFWPDASRVRARFRDGLTIPDRRYGSYLVDSASSHMLVSKIKPCMSKYKHFIP